MNRKSSLLLVVVGWYRGRPCMRLRCYPQYLQREETERRETRVIVAFHDIGMVTVDIAKSPQCLGCVAQNLRVPESFVRRIYVYVCADRNIVFR